MEAFWRQVDHSMVARGLIRASNQKSNPYTVNPSYTFWAPWIRCQSRRGPVVFNSEHRKCTRISSDTTEEEDGEVEKGISEEELIEMMHFAQVMTSVVFMKVTSK
ncbi:unnamed protein product [Porites lobata]|uniref:Uncharacterized protein n=1 Tax=Porites lobata TaxID=104759 RepID=A0ABN8QKS5_9CNID|nr:unnamed protein product [Porites lobata]